jgi:hypothetical protein
MPSAPPAQADGRAHTGGPAGPSRQGTAPARDAFLLNFIEHIPLDAAWYNALHAAGFPEATLRRFSELEENRTREFLEGQFPEMKPLDKFLLAAAIRNLSSSL